MHVYLGTTKFGVTAPVFVTGGGSQKSSHTNPKTGKTLTGVSAVEYQQDIVPKLIQEGNKTLMLVGKFKNKSHFRLSLGK